MVVAALLRRKYLSAKQMRALVKALDPCETSKSSAAHSAIIMAVELAALLLPSACDASLHGDNDVVKWTIVTVVLTATTY